jgi:hypothetical protein
MKSPQSLPRRAGLIGVAFLSAAVYAVAQTTPDHHAGMAAMMDHSPAATGLPTLPGQDAFGAIQEIVEILEADPTTDWSKVDIAALREHLIDMNEVALYAIAEVHPLDDGVDIAVTGKGRTLEAIRRMIPAHAHELNRIGWSARTEEIPGGVRLIVTTQDSNQAAKLKALGFMGIMVVGSHHQQHHLMIAKGELVH